MPDPIDQHQSRWEEFERKALAHARETVPDLAGESLCLRCGEANDRATAGYGVCSDCVETARG